MNRKHKRLTHKERVIIETLLNENKSKAYIAKNSIDLVQQYPEKLIR